MWRTDVELIIVRHGRPERVEGIDGGADPALTPIGHRQAEAMALWLSVESIDAIYVSPMVRAMQTCDPLAERLAINPVVDAGIREFNADDREYIPMEEVMADKGAMEAWVAKDRLNPRTEFHSKVQASVDTIVSEHRGERVVMVCHGGVINSVASRVLGLDGAMFFSPDYSSINRFMFSSRGHMTVLSLNDIGHLRPHPELQLS